MKRILLFLLAFVMMASAAQTVSYAGEEKDHETRCTTCKILGDLDRNDSVNMDDAVYLLYHLVFPERYPLPGHIGHQQNDCGICRQARDPDQNGLFDTEDAIYLLFHTQFPENYPLPGCTYDADLFVGYARVDITPEESMEIYGSTATSAHDPLQMTCTAVNDRETTALLFSLDLRSFSVDFCKELTDIIKTNFSIPADRVLFNITHTHSTPTITNGTGEGIRWRNKIKRQLKVVVADALADLDPVEGAYVGTDHTQDITFVRRYLLANGTYKMNPSASDKPIAHESEADTEMRTLRLDRKNKKDVVMVNYQTHYGSATGLYKGQYSADFVHVFREEMEKDLDCHFVYHSGASGNLNFMSAIPGERKYSTFVLATTNELVPTAKRCLDGEEEVSLGKLCYASNRYEAPVYQDTAEDIANAKTVYYSGYDTDSSEYKALLRQYGFSSYRQVQGIVTRSKLAKTLDVPFYAISFGEVGFASSPYEMFDTNGKEVREGSPFKMTFVCSYTNGGFGYVPSALAFPHGGYEVYITRFCEGSGEEFAQEMVRLLKECKKQSSL